MNESSTIVENQFAPAEETLQEPKMSKLKKAKTIILDMLKDILPAIACAYLIFGVIFNIVIVSGESMMPTIEDGSVVVVQHTLYTPERGDVIVCSPENYDKPLIKRVIGVAGDTIDINFETGDVYVNGNVLEEDYIAEKTYTDEGTAFPLTVEDGHVFVLGDNRNNSLDSRYPLIGQVSEDEIRGGLLWTIAG